MLHFYGIADLKIVYDPLYKKEAARHRETSIFKTIKNKSYDKRSKYRKKEECKITRGGFSISFFREEIPSFALALPTSGMERIIECVPNYSEGPSGEDIQVHGEPATKSPPKRSRRTSRSGEPGTKRAPNRGRSLPTAADLLRKVPRSVAGTPPGAVDQARKRLKTVAGPSPPRRTCYEKHPKT